MKKILLSAVVLVLFFTMNPALSFAKNNVISKNNFKMEYMGHTKQAIKKSNGDIKVEISVRRFYDPETNVMCYLSSVFFLGHITKIKGLSCVELTNKK